MTLRSRQRAVLCAPPAASEGIIRLLKGCWKATTLCHSHRSELVPQRRRCRVSYPRIATSSMHSYKMKLTYFLFDVIQFVFWISVQNWQLHYLTAKRGFSLLSPSLWVSLFLSLLICCHLSTVDSLIKTTHYFKVSFCVDTLHVPAFSLVSNFSPPRLGYTWMCEVIALQIKWPEN